MSSKTLADLISDPRNARKHNPRNVGMIEQALGEVGAARSIVLDENDVILAGNATVEAAAQAGIVNVQVVEADGNTIIAVKRRGLTEAQKAKLALYDNRTAELAEWDADVLAMLADEVDLSQLFRDDELAAILAAPEPGGGGDEFQAEPATEGPTRTAVGDIWSISGGHRLVVGDCTDPNNVDRLLSGDTVDITTDPPFGINIVENSPRLRELGYEQFAGDGDTQVARDAHALWSEFATLQVWWGANYYTDALAPARGWLVWDKDHHGMDFGDGELAWTNANIPIRIFRHAWSGADRDSEKGIPRDHPNQKPVALFEWCYQVVRAGKVVADPFAGAGASLIAAHRTKRQWRGMELSPRYADVILRRAEAEGLTCTRVEP